MNEQTLERYEQAVVEQTAQLAARMGRAAVDAPAPTCPERTLSHLGQAD